MISVAKSELKAHMLEYFRQIEKTGEDIVVTSHREPVLRISRLRKRLSPASVFAGLQGKVKYHGDLCESTVDEWSDLK